MYRVLGVLAACVGLAASAGAQEARGDLVVLEDEFGNVLVSSLDPAELGPVWAAAFEEAAEGRDMFNAGDAAGALEALEPLAEAGNPVAQNIVGLLRSDQGGAWSGFYDPEGARDALMAAAEQGYPPAMENLAHFYLTDHGGTGPNHGEAYRWYRAAADGGYTSAAYGVAAALAYGEGVEKNIPEARRYAEMALQSPDRVAETLALLAGLAYDGEGEPQNYAKALELYLASAEAGSGFGAFRAATQYYFGEGTEGNDAEALRLFALAWDRGEVRALGYLAQSYLHGYGTDPDPVAALAYGEEGVARADRFSMRIVADMLIHGLGTEPDYDRARNLAQQAADLGETYALVLLANMAVSGQGEPQDLEKAWDLYSQVLERDGSSQDALYSTGTMLLTGQGIAQDVPEGVRRLEAAQDSGSYSAVYMLALVYGSETYSVTAPDPVRGYAACLVIEDFGPGVSDPTRGLVQETCTNLAASLIVSEKAAARAEAAAF